MNVLIAGAGIGGLTAALALSRVGIETTIVERAPELAAVGAGLQLSPNATRILRRLGVLDTVAAPASRPDGIRVRSARSGGTLALMSLADAEARWGAPYLVAKRADLQRVLAPQPPKPMAWSHSVSVQPCVGFGAASSGVHGYLKTGSADPNDGGGRADWRRRHTIDCARTSC